MIEPQVIWSAAGLHGAGGYRAQCGLAEGTFMFIWFIKMYPKIPECILLYMFYRYLKADLRYSVLPHVNKFFIKADKQDKSVKIA